MMAAAPSAVVPLSSHQVVSCVVWTKIISSLVHPLQRLKVLFLVPFLTCKIPMWVLSYRLILEECRRDVCNPVLLLPLSYL
jgi:hypothetical protein